MLECQNTKALTAAAAALCGKADTRADLYSLSGKYRLIVRQGIYAPIIPKAIHSRLELCKTLEHGRCLIKNAVIRRAF